ncbi:MAG: nitroreductase family protein, partial [Erysipelotrichaceae bacterium]
MSRVSKRRYATKSFDPTKKLSETQLEQIEELLQGSSSSVNIQPWHFVIVISSSGKKRLTQATQGFFSFNTSKIMNASAIIVFASKIDMDEKYLRHLLKKEDMDGRYLKPAFKKQSNAGRKAFVDLHHY